MSSMFEPGNFALVHLLEGRAPEQAPPRDGATVVRPVAAKVPEVGNGFKMDVSGMWLAHLSPAKNVRWFIEPSAFPSVI